MQDDVMMGFVEFIKNASNDTFWEPIVSVEDKAKFDELFKKFEITYEAKDKNAKGKALEEITCELYKRFIGATVTKDIRTSDNQLDHSVTFNSFGVSPFIKEHVGYRFISESKNHKDSISSREVAQLYELLNLHEAKLGVFTSYKSFSKGLNGCIWRNGEGKRRKLALYLKNSSHKCKVIGLCYEDLHDLVYDEANLLDIFEAKMDKLLLDLEEEDSIEESNEENLLRMVKKLKAEKIFTNAEFKIFVERIRKNNSPSS